MYVSVKNENYGYAVSTAGNYVAVANPDFLPYDPTTGSFHTGSVDVFLYNKSKDEHDYVGTLYQLWKEMDVRLTTEANNSYDAATPLGAEDSGLVNYPDYNICIDKDLYTASIQNGYGAALDMYNTYLVVGTPYLTEITQTSSSFITESWAMAEVYDLARLAWTAGSASAAAFTIADPDFTTGVGVIGSFGQSISINNDWIAVGAPYHSGSNGLVYMYRNQTIGNNYSWSLSQIIQPTNPIPGAEFGLSLKLNKSDGLHSNSLVVGSGPIGSLAYYFEYINNSWTQTHVFSPDMSVSPMIFNPEYYPPSNNLVMNVFNGFGQSVGCYGDAVIVGEPYDRMFNEYNGSTLYQQGSTYIFERCITGSGWMQVLKTYGNPKTIDNNRMGWAVDMFGYNAVSGVPKIDVTNLTSCKIENTLTQLLYCESDKTALVNGQTLLIQKNTGSGAWEITNVYQKKKKFLSPYREFGFDVAVADYSMVVGSPMPISDTNRYINIETTQSSGVNLDDIMGKSYIYNWNNLRNQFYVGNVFYRNGKIVVMTSGSVFDNLFSNPINTYNYEYNVEFKSEHTIYEKQIICSVDPGEFNVSTNPTAITENIAAFDINGNGQFDFQDADIILRYMQYKNTAILGLPMSTDWSSSIVKSADEISLLNWYQANTNTSTTSNLLSQSLLTWETVNTAMQSNFDLNQDNRIDVRDMNILWKYFTNRLTQENYITYITPACNRRLFSDVTDYLNGLSGKFSMPLIKSDFADYERLTVLDKTGSFLAPYCTTIGLYDGLQLVALGKLGSPIKITPELPINMVLKIDF
jgi:hypothetical protein